MSESRPLVGLGRGWDRGQNSTFSEYGHVTYQIKRNHECSNMKTHIMSLHIHSTPGVGLNSQNMFY